MLVMVGCGPALSKQDLGTIVSEEPKIADADKSKETAASTLPAEREGKPAKHKDAAAESK
jgi:hypothetical protein